MIDLKDLSQFPPPVREFAQYKSIVQGCSDKTVTEYLFDIRTFCRYMVSVKKGLPLDSESLKDVYIADLDYAFFENVTSYEIYAFLVFAKNDRTNDTPTRARKLSAIKSLYKYLVVKEKKFENNPAAEIEAPKKKKQLPKHLSIDECVDLLTAVKSDPSSKTKERDYCILTLFLNCGMRLSELCGLNISDIRPDGTMRLLCKGNKERMVYCRSYFSSNCFSFIFLYVFISF